MRKLKAANDESNNAYGSLNKTDGLGEHTYVSLNKAGNGKNSSGTSNNNISVVYIAMTTPASNGGIDRSGGRSTGGDSKSKDSVSSDVNSARGGEVRRLNENLSPVFSPCALASSYHFFAYKLLFRAQTVDPSLEGPLSSKPTLARKAEKEEVRVYITHLSMMMYR